MTSIDQVPYVEHIGMTRQYWRDIILGVNDGLVSMLLLAAGVVGGGLDADQVLLTGVAGAIAGAVSMAAGEYLRPSRRIRCSSPDWLGADPSPITGKWRSPRSARCSRRWGHRRGTRRRWLRR
jgi:hypothetical protein